MASGAEISAWRPEVEGVVEVFHAHFLDHAYPSHTHDAWTLLIIDDGMVRYDLDRHEHGALQGLVTVLPPHVPHDGRSVNPDGFRKRVVYLDSSVLPEALIGPSVDQPELSDHDLRGQIDRLHRTLALPGEEFEAQSRLALVSERLQQHLGNRGAPQRSRNRPLAEALRDRLDTNVVEGVLLAQAANDLGVSSAHLVRTFTREFGIPPHRYLTGRRIDLARRLLLAGRPSADVAVDTGFFDQAHLNRHFRQMLGTSPGRFARSSSQTP